MVACYRGISIWQSGLGVELLINIVFSLSVSGISIGGHLGGLVGGAIAGWLFVELGERRRMPGAGDGRLPRGRRGERRSARSRSPEAPG